MNYWIAEDCHLYTYMLSCNSIVASMLYQLLSSSVETTAKDRLKAWPPTPIPHPTDSCHISSATYWQHLAMNVKWPDSQIWFCYFNSQQQCLFQHTLSTVLEICMATETAPIPICPCTFYFPSHLFHFHPHKISVPSLSVPTKNWNKKGAAKCWKWGG